MIKVDIGKYNFIAEKAEGGIQIQVRIEEA